MIACLKLLNQCHLKLYHYTIRPHLQPDHGLGFYMRVEADDRTIRLRKQRQAQYAESSDQFRTGQCLCDVRARCGMVSFVKAIYRDTRSAVRGCSFDITLTF